MNQKPGRLVYALWCMLIFLLLVFKKFLLLLSWPFRALFELKGRQTEIAGWKWRYRWSWGLLTGLRLVKLVEEELAAEIDLDVVIHVPDQAKAEVIEDGRFHLHLWANPAGNRFRNVPSELYGLIVSKPDEALAPTGQGFSIDDPSGWSVAELIGERNVFTHPNLVHSGSEAEFALLKRLLQDVVEVVRLPADKRREREIRLISERRIASRKMLIERCTDPRFPQIVEERRKAIDDGQRGIEFIQAGVFVSGRAACELEREFNEVLALDERKRQRLGADIDKLNEIEGVEMVLWEKGKIALFTDTLYCTDPRSGIRHLIGKFRIELFPDGINGGVLWHNLTHRVDGWEAGMNAPHILANGRACLGNTQQLFPKLIGTDQLAQLATLAVRFPQSVNVNDSAGKFIDRWPKAETTSGKTTLQPEQAGK